MLSEIYTCEGPEWGDEMGRNERIQRAVVTFSVKTPVIILTFSCKSLLHLFKDLTPSL